MDTYHNASVGIATAPDTRPSHSLMRQHRKQHSFFALDQQQDLKMTAGSASHLSGSMHLRVQHRPTPNPNPVTLPIPPWFQLPSGFETNSLGTKLLQQSPAHS